MMDILGSNKLKPYMISHCSTYTNIVIHTAGLYLRACTFCTSLGSTIGSAGISSFLLKIYGYAQATNSSYITSNIEKMEGLLPT
jgi:hypothetical protein